MGCYSDEVKAKASGFVMIVSVAVFIAAVLTLAYGYAQSTGQEIQNDYTTFKVDKSGFAGLVLLGGLLALITAILGCLTAKFKKFFLAIPFGLCSFIIAVILLIAGAVAGGFDGKIEELRATACTQPITAYGGITGEEWIGRQYGKLVDDVMCSEACPCANGGGNQKLWDDYGEAYLNKYNRTISTATTEQLGTRGAFVNGAY